MAGLCTPCRRFAGALAGVCARLGADVDRYSFTVRDLHPLLLAGLPATPKTCTKTEVWHFQNMSAVPRRSQPVDATLYLKERWSVL